MRYLLAIILCHFINTSTGQLTVDSLLRKVYKNTDRVDSVAGSAELSLAGLDSLRIFKVAQGQVDAIKGKIGSVKQLRGKSDSLFSLIESNQTKYLNVVNRKLDIFQSRVLSLNRKSYTRLARWEAKLRRQIEKINPALASKLFNDNRFNFSKLESIQRSGEQALLNYRARYDQYRDKVSINVKYLSQKNQEVSNELYKRTKELDDEVRKLDSLMSVTEGLEEKIKQRRTELLSSLQQALTSNRYSRKISREAYYYSEKLRNYKEIFSDPHDVEIKLLSVIQQIPGFSQFAANNSFISGMFPGLTTSSTSTIIEGLQTKQQIDGLLANASKIGGSQVSQAISQHVGEAKAKLSGIKDRISQQGSASVELPDFKPNSQKSRTLAQRIEYGFNIQFSKANRLVPHGANIGLEAGYKLNNRSIIGVGIATRVGISTNPKVSFNNNGISLRSFLDWRLKRQFFITGGLERHFFRYSESGSNFREADMSHLVGISKKISFSGKLVKGLKVQLLYDLTHQGNVLQSQPIIFRITQVVKN